MKSISIFVFLLVSWGFLSGLANGQEAVDSQLLLNEEECKPHNNILYKACDPNLYNHFASAFRSLLQKQDNQAWMIISFGADWCSRCRFHKDNAERNQSFKKDFPIQVSLPFEYTKGRRSGGDFVLATLEVVAELSQFFNQKVVRYIDGYPTYLLLNPKLKKICKINLGNSDFTGFDKPEIVKFIHKTINECR